jgi:hypothetical protein
MSAGKIPTTLSPLKAEHDSKIAGRNAVMLRPQAGFFVQRRFISARFRAPGILRREIQEARDLQDFLVVDCNG